MRRLFTPGRREHEPTRREPPELVLHVGLHKTGSTLLQRLLREARTDLRARSVIVRPRDDLYGDREFLRVVRGLHAERPAEDAMVASVTHRARELLHPSDRERVVFSDETLLGTFPDFRRSVDAYIAGIPALRWFVDEVASPVPVRVLMYVRRQDQFLESVYVQLIHQGSTETFSDWFSSIDVRRFDWLRLSRCVEEVVGPGNLVVRPFETIRSGPASFFQEFLRLIDADLRVSLADDVIERIAQGANRSLSGKALEIARRAYPVLTDEERFTLRQFLQSKFSNREYPRAELLAPEQAAAILTVHRDSNATLFERYMPDHDPADLGYL